MTLEESAELLSREQHDFAESFYRDLFRDHPQLRQYFVDVDMATQQKKLVTALITVQQHATKGGWVSENYLQSLGRKHEGMNIGPQEFRLFVEKVIPVMQQFHGDKWNHQLETEWRDALSAAIHVMLSTYTKSPFRP